MKRAEYDIPRLVASLKAGPDGETEVSGAFLQGMIDRMLVSRHKYGPIADGIHKLDCIASMEQRLAIYTETGNVEGLIDAANFLMMEFMFPKVSGAYFEQTDSDQSPGRRLRSGAQSFGTNEDHSKPVRSILSRLREEA